MTEPTNREDLTDFFVIAHRWQLDSCDEAVLLGVDQPDLESSLRDSDATALSDETLERLNQLMRIDAGLQILLPLPERADSWGRQPNAAPILAGGSAFSYMLRDRLSDFCDVANYLAGYCCGDHLQMAIRTSHQTASWRQKEQR